MKSILEVLTEARTRITEPGTWIVGYLAKDQFGMPVNSASRGADSFCALGAVFAGTGGDWNTSSATEAIRALARVLGVSDMDALVAAATIARWNNSHSHEEVLALFDQAIERSASAR
jgi:hypothetical protein